MEPLTFFGIVLTIAVGAILASSHSNSKKIKELEDKFPKKDVIDEKKERVIDELITNNK